MNQGRSRPDGQIDLRNEMILAIAAVAVLVGAAWCVFRDSRDIVPGRLTTTSGSYERATERRDDRCASSGSIKTKISTSNPALPKLRFYYASQRGTAEEFAQTLAKQGILRKLQASAIDLENFSNLIGSPEDFKDGACCIFLVATYGEGEPTDNSKRFFEWLRTEAVTGDLVGIHFAVFGLGDSTYKHYNTMGILCDAELSRLGGTRILELGLGDDDKNMQRAFEVWQRKMWPGQFQPFKAAAAVHKRYKVVGRSPLPKQKQVDILGLLSHALDRTNRNAVKSKKIALMCGTLQCPS